MPTDLTSLTASLQALLTPLVAVITVYIAYQQYRIRRDERALQLYDRRLKIYRNAIGVLDRIRSGDCMVIDEVWEWEASLKEADFLFGREVQFALEALFTVVFEFASECEQSPEEGHQTQAAAEYAIRAESLRTPTMDAFRPYLRPTDGLWPRKTRMSLRRVRRAIEKADPQNDNLRMDKAVSKPIAPGDDDVPF